MNSWRHRVGCLMLAASISAGAPASAIAAGGGSAGDQQYVDPLAGLHSHTHKSTTSTSSGSTSPSPSAGSSSDSSNTTSGAPVAGTTTSTSADPTATTASGGRKLPFTGFDPLPGVAVGAALIGGGLVLRRKARRA